MRYVIGLTGGIASGKSAVSDIIARSGIRIIDADIISRKVMSKGEPCYNEVVTAFPESLVNGELDRRALRKIVFSDEQKLSILNSITHKHIKAETKREIEREEGLVLLVVPLMFESGFDSFCSCVINVTCDMQERINRVIKRDNINKELAISIINSQMSDSERCQKSNYIINNNGDIDNLRVEVEKVLKTIKESLK